MRRILPGCCSRCTACCSVLVLLLALVSGDASWAQQQYQGRPDLTIELNEQYWKPRSPVPVRVVGLCVVNIGTWRSGAALFQLLHSRTGRTEYQRQIRPLTPKDTEDKECVALEISAMPQWRGKTEIFVASVSALAGTDYDANPSNNRRQFWIKFPPGRPQMVDLELESASGRYDSFTDQLIVQFRVTNIGNARSRNTTIGIRIAGRDLLGVGGLPPIAPDDSFPGEMKIRLSENWTGTREFIAIVDPDRKTGDENPGNNFRRFPVAFGWPIDGTRPSSDGGAGVLMTIAVIGGIVALVIWLVGKRKQQPQSASPTFRAEAHPDAGTQSIRLKSDDIVLPDLRLRSVPDAGTQWIALRDVGAKE